ncbi:hypothetical protein GW17_00047507 [Ensete ventricosum]|nr:hypothetical protein GW17_00047507 [Ensete ventricosum]
MDSCRGKSGQSVAMATLSPSLAASSSRLGSSSPEPTARHMRQGTFSNILALEGGLDVLETLSTLQPRGGYSVHGVVDPTVAPQPMPPLSLLNDGNPTTHTPGHYWRLFNDLGLTSPVPNLRSLAVTPEAFLGLTNQVQTIVGMLQMIIPYIPQLSQQPSFQLQLRLVNQRIDDVQKEVIRSKDNLRESSIGDSPFVLEIQDKPIPQHFRLPMLEAYDGDSNPIDHVVTFRTHMALYGTSNAIIC